MKTNLDSLYKTNKNLETEGVWFDLSDETGFKVRRVEQSVINKTISLKYKKHARQFSLGTIDEEVQRKIITEIFVDKFLVDWRGVEIDDKEVEFSREAAIKLFMELKDLCDSVMGYASSIESFKEDLGNV